MNKHDIQVKIFIQTKLSIIQQQYFYQSQNPINTHSYQPTQMQNEIPLPYFLQQPEITNTQLTNFSQRPNAAESSRMTMNPYILSRSSISSNKPLMIFTGSRKLFKCRYS